MSAPKKPPPMIVAILSNDIHNKAILYLAYRKGIRRVALVSLQHADAAASVRYLQNQGICGAVS